MTGAITNLAAIAPLGVWIAGGVGAVVFTAVLVRLIRKQRATQPDAERMSRLQLIGALAFSAVVVASFVIGTFEGGVAFADHYLGWDNWRRVIPWGSFDASSMAFSLFAIRAIGRGRSPKRAMRVVYASAGASACVQLLEGGDLHTWQGGAFLAALAVGSTMVVHSVIDQIRGKEALVGEEEKLRFRKRWLTSFPSTVCAWLAWTNFPPENLAPTVRNALRHLEEVRAGKRARMTERPAWWAIQPWLYASRIARNAEQLRAEHIAESARLADDSARITEQVAEHIRELSARLAAADSRAHVAEQDAIRREHNARVETEQAVRAEAEQELAELREQLREGQRVMPPRSARTESTRPAARRAGQVSATSALDEQIVEKLLGPFSEQADQTGSVPSRYWVQQNGSCWPRQASRVLDLLSARYTESKREPKSGSAREQTDDASERELVRTA